MTEQAPAVGCVHGRFQPPHLEHLEYIEAALARCGSLIIGITQPDRENLDDCTLDPHRAILAENPLTYDERCECIRVMLIDRGADPTRFTFMKFLIDKPSELVKALNKDVVCYTTIRTTWNLGKIAILEDAGFNVEVLWDRRGEPAITGTEIRQRIRMGNPSWKDLVHPTVADLLEGMGAVEKIQMSK